MYVERVETRKDACCILIVWCLAVVVVAYTLFLIFQLPEVDPNYLRGYNDLR